MTVICFHGLPTILYLYQHNLLTYDLLTLAVIKLGDKVYNGKKENEGYELLRFLNTIMYPHKEDFMDTVSEYFDFFMMKSCGRK